MAEPTTGLSIGEWFAAIVASTIAGMGGAMAWFNREKNSMRAKMHTIQNDMVAWNMALAEQKQKHAVMEEKHANIKEKLGDIEGYCERLDGKMDEVLKVLQTKT